jgi:uncharacterized protein (TIGR03435 family)
MSANGDFAATGVALIRLLGYAYDLPVNPSPRLSGIPDWILGEKYDIQAKAPADAADLESLNRSRQMIRALLADQFKLVMRVDKRATPVYVLRVGTGGARLEKSSIGERDCVANTGPEPCHSFAGGLGHPLVAKAIVMDDLARYIENWSDLPVVNLTGPTGLYTTNTEGWLPMRLPPPPPNAAAASNPFEGLPTIFTVLGKLGLDLKREEHVVPFYTVERIERPSAN